MIPDSTNTQPKGPELKTTGTASFQKPSVLNTIKQKHSDPTSAFKQYELGEKYEEGIGVEKSAKEAFRLYHLAAEQGFSSAQWRLACCYRSGIGIGKDVRKAEEWFLKAANQKHDVALVHLAEMHESGQAADSSPAKAAHWYRLSADQGYRLAQHRLGRCYERGIGVTRDLNQAIHWYELAAKQDFGPAKDDYQRLSESVWKRGERKFPTWDSKTARELEKVCLTLPIRSRQKALEFFQEANKVAGRSDAPLERQSCDLFEGLAGVVAASDRKEISAAWDCNGDEFLSGFLVVETHDHVIGTLTCIARISESSFLTRTWSGGVRESVKQLVSASVGNRSRPTVETASAIHSPSWEPTVSKSYQRIDSSLASDFSHVYPRYCNICTTHPTTAVDANWSVTVLGLAIGTHLGMRDINDVERLLLKMKERGFEIRTCANFTEEQVLSEELDHLPAGVCGSFRTRTILMPDPIKRGSLGHPTFVRLVFYFDVQTDSIKSTNETSDEIKEIRLNKSYRIKVGMNNGLDVNCPTCGGITPHELYTPDAVRCCVCKRIIKLIWV